MCLELEATPTRGLCRASEAGTYCPLKSNDGPDGVEHLRTGSSIFILRGQRDYQAGLGTMRMRMKSLPMRNDMYEFLFSLYTYHLHCFCKHKLLRISWEIRKPRQAVTEY